MSKKGKIFMWLIIMALIIAVVVIIVMNMVPKAEQISYDEFVGYVTNARYYDYDADGNRGEPKPWRDENGNDVLPDGFVISADGKKWEKRDGAGELIVIDKIVFKIAVSP